MISARHRQTPRRRAHAMRIAALGVALLHSAALHALTAVEHLGAAERPVFREGHTLLPLTRWGWTMPFDVFCE